MTKTPVVKPFNAPSREIGIDEDRAEGSKGRNTWGEDDPMSDLTMDEDQCT
jgi:hypothetical protein